MRTFVALIARIDIFLYVVFGITAVFAIRNFIQSRRGKAVSLFALEKESQKNRQMRSLRTLVLLLVGTITVYLISNIIYPNLVGEEIVVEEEPLVFVEQAPTPTSFLLLYPTVTPTLGLVGSAAEPDEIINGCEILGSTITSPAPNEIVSGQVRVEGESNILNFGMYKFEVSGVGTNGAWIVVGTYNTPVPLGTLGSWDSTSLMPGAYILRLVTIRSDGTYLTPCEVPITIGGAVPGTTEES